MILSLLTVADAVFSAEISSFVKLYEPSGVVQLKTGEVVIVEDKGDKPFYITLPQQNSTEGLLENGKSLAVGVAVDDLKSLTSSPDSTLFAITSHSITKKGKRKDKREQLLMPEVNRREVQPLGRTTSLQPPILEKLKHLAGDDFVQERITETFCFIYGALLV